MTTFEYASARLVSLRRRFRLVPLLLTVLGWPLVTAGRTAYGLVVAARWARAAVVLGYVEARSRSARAG